MKFIKYRYVGYIFSGILMLIFFISFFTKGFNFGIDFTGGVLVQVKFKKPVEIQILRQALKTENLSDAIIQRIGRPIENRYIIKTKLREENIDVSELIKQNLIKAIGEENINLPFESSEEVGPAIGKDLRNTAYVLIFISLIAILLYVSFRFKLKYAVGGILALAHDVIVVLGAFSLTNREVDIPIVAAVLTIIGYSINDTIVIYDRIRENLKIKRDLSFDRLIDVSIMETLSRTIITSLTVFVTILALFIWGGAVIHNFAFAFLIGTISGTYSTIFIASPFVYDWEMSALKSKQKR